MKLVVFGASRGVGLHVVKQALEAGYSVSAFVRSPGSFPIQQPGLTIVRGDAMNAEEVARAIAGQEAVVSALGPSRPPAPHMMETAARNIVDGMRTHGVRRLVSTTGAGVFQPEDSPKAIDRFIGFLLNLFAKEVGLDSAANVKVIAASDLDWTVVRFPRLMDGAHTGRYRVGYLGRDSGAMITRADAADFVLRELTERKWLRKLPVVSN